MLGGLAALVLHDIADFSIEMPAVAMMAVVAASMLLPARLGTTTEADGARPQAAPRKAVAIRVAVITGALAITALALSPIGRTSRADASWIADTEDPADRAARAHVALQRHPGDHVVAGRAAEALFAIRDARGLPDARALALIRRAIAMNPNHSGLHHLAARMLLHTASREQAAPEFAAAARWAIDVEPIVADVLRAFADPALVARSLPTEPGNAWRILAAIGDRKPAGLAYAQRVAQLHPRNASMQALLAAGALAERRADLAIPAARAAWHLEAIAKHATLLAQALAMGGDRAGAIAVLTEAAEHDHTSSVAHRCDMLFTLATLQVEAADLEGAKVTLARAGNVGANERGTLAAMHLRLAEVEDLLGNRNQAEWERNRARELQRD